MKKYFIYAFLLGAMTLAGCGSDDTEDPTPVPKPIPEYDNLRDSIGTATRPTDWVRLDIDKLNPTVKDVIIITSEEIPVPVDTSEDLVGAFVDGECRDVAAFYEEANGKVAAQLIVMPKKEESTSFSMELRYYSKHNKRIYLAAPFAFDSNATDHGSLTGSGYKVKWR